MNDKRHSCFIFTSPALLLPVITIPEIEFCPRRLSFAIHLNRVMNDDTSDERAHLRSKLGLCRELQTTRSKNNPEPSKGGTRGYPVWFRQRVLAYAGFHGVRAAAEHWGCCEKSVRNWQERVIPFRMTGGMQRTSIVAGDQLLLAIGLFIYPSSTADEIATFIIANGGGVYTRDQITSRCSDLGYTRKRCSKEAYDAFSDSSLQKLRWFNTLPPPLGVKNIPLHRLIDVDKTGFYLSKCGSDYARGYSACRVRIPAHYTRANPKVNVLFGLEAGNQNLPADVDGSVERPRRWIKITYENCDQLIFSDFMNTICHHIETAPVPGGFDDDKVIMWDGLSVHNTNLVLQTIQGRQSHHVFHTVTRPPYRPKIAPVEYAFCELACELNKRVQPHWTIVQLRTNIVDILSNIGMNGKFRNTFIHCGYPL